MSKTGQVDVLLVEDDSNDAEMTVWALEKNQLMGRVHRMKDGAEAIEYLFGKERPADLARIKVVLLDIKLPKLDGFEVLRKIKLDPALKLIPVVILTSSNETRDRQAGYSLGVNSYVVKPVDFDQFVETIGQLGKYWLNVNRSST